VEQLNLSNRPCAYGVLQPGDDMADGIPFVRVGDIDDGRIDLTTLKRISPKIAAQYPRTKLIGGEFLITLVGAIGRTALVPETLAGANVARAVGVVPLADALNARWVEFWFRNPAKVIEMTSKSHEVARKTLNLEDVRAASVAVPPLAEQHLIVAEVDRRLSILRETEAQVDANLQHAERLRQSILERAYSGDRDRIYAVNMEPSELPL
jgi:type I restriction enzyme S subunit